MWSLVVEKRSELALMVLRRLLTVYRPSVSYFLGVADFCDAVLETDGQL